MDNANEHFTYPQIVNSIIHVQLDDFLQDPKPKWETHDCSQSQYVKPTHSRLCHTFHGWK